MSKPIYTTEELRNVGYLPEAELEELARRFTQDAIEAHESHKLMLKMLKHRLLQSLKNDSYNPLQMAQAMAVVIDGEAKCYDLYLNHYQPIFPSMQQQEPFA